MANTWKQASKDYKKHLYERHLLEETEIPLTENDFDLAAFKRNPERFFDENGWTVPEEHFEEITVALAELAQSDSEISPEEVELGKKGKKVQEIVQELAKKDKRFASIMKMVSQKNHLTEGKGKRILATSLLCLAILLTGVGCTTTGNIGDLIPNDPASASPGITPPISIPDGYKFISHSNGSYEIISEKETSLARTSAISSKIESIQIIENTPVSNEWGHKTYNSSKDYLEAKILCYQAGKAYSKFEYDTDYFDIEVRKDGVKLGIHGWGKFFYDIESLEIIVAKKGSTDLTICYNSAFYYNDWVNTNKYVTIDRNKFAEILNSEITEFRIRIINNNNHKTYGMTLSGENLRIFKLYFNRINSYPSFND